MEKIETTAAPQPIPQTVPRPAPSEAEVRQAVQQRVAARDQRIAAVDEAGRSLDQIKAQIETAGRTPKLRKLEADCEDLLVKSRMQVGQTTRQLFELQASRPAAGAFVLPDGSRMITLADGRLCQLSEPTPATADPASFPRPGDRTMDQTLDPQFLDELARFRPAWSGRPASDANLLRLVQQLNSAASGTQTRVTYLGKAYEFHALPGRPQFELDSNGVLRQNIAWRPVTKFGLAHKWTPAASYVRLADLDADALMKNLPGAGADDVVLKAKLKPGRLAVTPAWVGIVTASDKRYASAPPVLPAFVVYSSTPQQAQQLARLLAELARRGQ